MNTTYLEERERERKKEAKIEKRREKRIDEECSSKKKDPERILLFDVQ